ncbi:Uncharacterised protein [Mycobacteroides abscessus subsp. massiliense]|uniref:hypothetical protein n=1 Tax=Mycobacteroides abscessus TaxID=36809 RepID=UPI0009A5E4CF|nr:hypothetical protein [Mycobacteroides abscessus]SKE70784.1 Uncharacterised protein [Mycobacteroides abscessus subsp. massiliense]SKH80511.1 Uncharacterised protein [Mycobacteroides abscessus subsp. massiliense]SKI34226.1 Uncharacterised protein [Mycobacteroides abscessus subsp. massiliense]SKJ36977.1 Uncharacterised protein [Mycobacteroides abscessus subsp. massiliense]SKK23199.1 Uncharacterised protein [Mycobacteroides abscessus subsp. massiliense]
MNKNIGAVALAAITLATTACTPPAESISAPSSSVAAAPSSSAVHEYRKARAEEAKREMRLHVESGIPHDVDRRYAEAASKDGVPFAFTYGEGCSWVRLPDKTLWPLHAAGGPLTRDTAAEQRFGSWPGAGVSESRPCPAAVGIPVADDPSSPGPYRWVEERGFQRLRWNGAVYAVPAEIPPAGTVLRDAVVHGPAPTLGEVVPGVPAGN